MANEVHSPETRKNQECQDKLPVVVFKAEEIIYSKANSEVPFSFLLFFFSYYFFSLSPF
jgi:hypothetical protein